jgi:hypothetical protein
MISSNLTEKTTCLNYKDPPVKKTIDAYTEGPTDPIITARGQNVEFLDVTALVRIITTDFQWLNNYYI